MQYRILLSILCSLLLALTTSRAVEPTRQCYDINDGWRFYYTSELDGANADYVTLPHSWQTTLGSYGYVASAANYIRTLNIPAEWEGKRLFLRFGGVQSVAELFVNGRYVGSHKGGFTAFTMEITHYVKYGAENYIRVVASCGERSDVLPLSSDMDLTAGIYRGVELMVTPKHIISPLHHSSEGVYVVQESVDKDRAIGVVRCYLSTPGVDNANLALRIVGPDGYEAQYRHMRATKISSDRAIEIPYDITMPALWSPENPQMYRVELTLEAGKMTDRVEVVTGFRKVSISDDNKLCINGKPYAVRGVNLAHDRMGLGMAISEENLVEDFAAVCDLGANAVRSMSGPHMPLLYDMCDSEGVLAWVDMPFTRSPLAFSDICYYPHDAFRSNGKAQLEEIVAQNYNHPSIVMWGLFSLVWQRGDDVVDYVKELNTLAHKLDPSRPTVGCSNSDGGINFVTDLIVLRQDVGLYKGRVEDVGVWCRQLAGNKQFATLRYGVCYGEEGVAEHATDRVERAERGAKHIPERRQTYMHEGYSAIIDSMGNFWGVWLDNMYDYASSRRAYALNQSGLVGYDHRSHKDAYYLYRAKWNARANTLHIADRSWRERRDTLQQIDVYSSAEGLLLLVNGDTARVERIAAGHFRADSVIINGKAVIEARDTVNSLSDKVEIVCGSKL